jgi:hypothetical protein
MHSTRKLAALFLVFLLVGCASQADFRQNLKSEDYLFNDNRYTAIQEIYSESSISELVGKYSGYIPLIQSKERAEFENIFPATRFDNQAQDSINASSYIHRLGQVMRLSADLDARTSGFAKDETGKPYSVSGMIENIRGVDTSSAISAGAAQAILASTGSSAVISPGAGLGANVGLGLFAGFVAGAIHQIQSEAAIKGIVSKKTFGERMEETTFSIAAPSATSLSKFGEMTRSGNFAKISPYSVYGILAVNSGKDLTYHNRVSLLGVVGTYRGSKYRDLYPKTEGWEFTITNIVLVKIQDADMFIPAKSNAALRKEFSRVGIRF